MAEQDAERLRAALFAHMITGFAYHRVVLDDAGRPIDYVFLEINPAFERLTGLRAADLIGRRVTEALPGIEDDPADWIGTYGRVALGGEPVRFEQYSQALDRWYNVAAYSPEPEHFAVTFDEITALKKAEAERDRLIEDLERKNEELERFAYTASHELRSPLITIQGFVDALGEDLEEGDTQAVGEDLQRIGRAADRMGTMLDDLLNLSRIGRLVGDAGATPFGHLLDEARARVAGALGDIELRVSGRDVAVWGDRARLVEVLQNLLDNAAKFTRHQPNPEIRIDAEYTEAGCRIAVIDNGIGLDPAYHDRVFRLFERLDGSTPGTGIGLALVKRIVDHHGGRVVLSSEGLGAGCAVRIELPSPGAKP